MYNNYGTPLPPAMMGVMDNQNIFLDGAGAYYNGRTVHPITKVSF